MPESSKRPKGKLKWSNLYSFSCFRPSVADDASVHLHFVRPGFSRMVFCNESNLHKTKPYKYPDNYVSSTKYNILTFLPKALFEQFRRVANLYFLLAAVLSLSPLSPFSKVSQIAPLVFVVGISMIKEGVEDWHRFLQDLDINSRPVKVHIGNGLFVNKKWRSLLVGDVVKVDKNEYFPSDLLLLSSSYEDGVCYVETMNLDGETNLKVKRCFEATLCLDKDASFNDFQATIRCEDPNSDLYTFVGNLEFKNQSLSLSPSQVLLRDSKLRNTEYVYGVVIFSGADTKAVRNSTKSPGKRSRIERKMDQVIYLLFSMLVLVSLATSIGFVISLESKMKDMWYLRLQKDKNFNPSKPLESSIRQFIRALMLYGYLIPISLYVSIELVKVLQAVLINNDIEMYDELTGKSVIARTSNLNEELGQVEVILTDKTGTLTCNQMEFRKCSIAGVSYGGDSTVIDRAASRRMNVDIETYEFSLDEAKSVEQSLEIFEFSVDDINTQRAVLRDQKDEEIPNINPQYSRILPLEKRAAIKGFNFNDDRLNDKNWISGSKQSSEVVMFLRVMALCHTGIPVEDGQSDKLTYEAESPEEVSFLIAAQEFGFKFFHRTQSMLIVKEIEPSSGKEVERKYKLLNLLEFSSSRKRMSVIVSNEEDQIFLLCKGADSIIFDRLSESGQSHQAMTNSHLSKYAEDGFRTLAFAYRMLEKGEYENWNSIFIQAKTTIGPEREELLVNASEMIEKDLNLLGAVAVEDKLQKGVPECIDKLAQAGLKIWLLTGDKRETAINIGFSCSLLRHDTKQFHLSLSKEIESKGKSKDMIEDIFHQLEIYYTYQVTNKEKNKSFALVVDGKALEIALRKEVKGQFLQLAVSCASVICCRVSPKQKALVARSVKEYTGKTILAVGDGANDVGMIQEADIGVGISGMEGMQAVMASDFSLPQFRFLERLLIVHGHWCYKRISKMILYFVYKNIAFGLTLFYFEKYTSFSGEVLFDDWYLVLFNLLFTSMPVISLGVLDQDVSSDVCLKFPALYQQGQKNMFFSWYRVFGWMMNGVLASLAAFLLNIYTLSPAAFRGNGNAADLGQIGATTYTCVIWTVNCQIALIISHFTWIQHLFIWGSIISWYIFMLVYGILPPKYSNRGFQVLKEIGPALVYWSLTLLVLVVSLLPYFIHIVIQRIFYPMNDHVLLEMKYLRKDITDNPMWLREQQNSKKKTQIGFSSRVDAKIDQLKRRLWQTKAALQGSVANSPVYETVATNPVFSHQE